MLKGVGRLGLKPLPIFFQPSHRNFEPPFSKIYNYSTPYCTSTMAYGVICYSFLFFIDTLKPTYKLLQPCDEGEKDRKNC